jgi:DNA-binding response OmpR family regulator
VPLVVLSASLDVADKVLLLEMGADDYVTMPSSPINLLLNRRVALHDRVLVSVKKAFGDACIGMRTTADVSGRPPPTLRGIKAPRASYQLKTLQTTEGK